MSLLDNFIKYVKIDTQADDSSSTSPSTLKQLDLENVLLNDLKELGIECYQDEFGLVYGFISGDESLPTIGLNAHVDTALEVTDTGVKPKIIKNYDGKDIKLNDKYTISTKQFPRLKDFVGKTLVTTDGNTLLGADDKAGVAIIMEVAKYFATHKEIRHHPISILFTTDEEIGRGPIHFDSKKFKAKYAYTVDGDTPYQIAIENFFAYAVNIDIDGISIHPGEAKDKMVNAILVASKFMSTLPSNMIPSLTSGHEGFNHINEISGNVEHAHLEYIVRNHDIELLNRQLNDFKIAKAACEVLFPKAKIDMKFIHQYDNMLEIIKATPEVTKKLEDSYKKLGISFTYEPIRGGTDGATFSYKGCPTPNLGTGSYNHHGRLEYAVVEEMELMVEIIKAIMIQ